MRRLLPSLISPTSITFNRSLITDLRRMRTEIISLVLLLLTALAIRLWLLPKGAFIADIVQFKIWGEQLVSASLADYYRLAGPTADYLPGYLYVLAALERVRILVSGPVSMLEQYIIWIKLPSLAADILLCTAVFMLVRRLAGFKPALVATALVAFDPGLIFVSAVWGQTDSVGCALSMMSLFVLISGNPIAATVLGGLAFLTKPQYSLFLGIAGIAYLRGQLALLPPLNSRIAVLAWIRATILKLLLPLVALIATLQMALLPFSVSLWPGPNVEWTFRARLMAAGTLTPVTNLNAFNLWGTPIVGMEIPDTQIGWFSLSYQAWGFILLAVVILICILLAWRSFDDPVAILWSCFVISLAFFVLPTRIHERYLFAAIPLVAIASVVVRWAIPFYVLVSVLYFTNVLYGYTVLSGIGSAGYRFIVHPGLLSVASIIAVLLLIGSLIITIRILFSTRIQSRKGGLWD